MAFLLDTWTTNMSGDALVLSPDGGRIAAGCGASVYLWDVNTGQMALDPLEGHVEPVGCVAFSPDGHTLAAGAAWVIRIWNTENGELIVRIPSRNISLWSSGTGEPHEKGHLGTLTSVVFSHDGRLLVSAGGDKSIRLWDTQTWGEAKEAIYTGSFPNSLAISLDDRIIFCALSNRKIRAYDAATGAVVFESIGHTDNAWSIALSPNGQRIASASSDQTVRIWDAATGHQIGPPLTGHTEGAGAVVFSPDGRYIASGSLDHTIRIWDAETGDIHSGPLSGHTSVIMDLAFTLDGTRLISLSQDRTIKIWDVRALGIQAAAVRELISMEAEPLSAEITSATSPEMVVSQLGIRGCPNMTNELDWSTCTENPISRGGFGDVYRCSMRNGTEVAVKTIRPYVGSSDQSRKHLKHAARELYTWAKCRHPNVQQLLGLVMLRGQLGMITRWEPNGSLPQYLEQHPSADRCVLSTQVTAGLMYLHDSGVVHGDLKGVRAHIFVYVSRLLTTLPQANVLVSKDGAAQLSDFGNATLREYTLHFSNNSTKESLSPRWAAPELFKGGKCDVHTDIYALGMTILEIITGEAPWAGKGDHTVLFAVVVDKAHPERPEASIPVYSEHGDRLWSLLKSCWEFEPEMRVSATAVYEIMKGITQNGLRSGEVEMDDVV